MKSTILVVLLVVSLFSKNKAYRLSEQSNVVKEPYLSNYDLNLLDTDAIYERLRKLRNNLPVSTAYGSSNEEVAPYEEEARPKRGRQCLWKICSWSLEKSKKKSFPLTHNNII